MNGGVTDPRAWHGELLALKTWLVVLYGVLGGQWQVGCLQNVSASGDSPVCCRLAFHVYCNVISTLLSTLRASNDLAV